MAGGDITVQFDSDEQLATIQNDITGPESVSLTTADFTETDNGDGTYTYSATVTVSSDGDYTSELVTAEDAAGNDGGGATDTVSFGASAAVTRDFETGDLSNWTGDTGAFTVDQTQVYEGSYALHHDGSTDGNLNTTFTSDSYSEVSWWVYINDVSVDSTPGFMLFNGGTAFTKIRNDTGSVVGSAGEVIVDETGSGGWLATGIVLNSGQYYKFTLTPDFANDQFTLAVEDTSGSQVGSQSAISAQSSLSGFDEFRARGQSEESWLDLLEFFA